MIRLSRRTTLTEWQIQRKLARFKLHQIQKRLDGLAWKSNMMWNADGLDWMTSPPQENPEGDELSALETLLHAGVKQSRRVMNGIQGMSPCHVFVSQLLPTAQRREEKDISYRDEYARKFYGVKP